MRVSIGRKLTLSYLLLALLVGVLGFVGYSNMRETGKQVDVIQRETDGVRTLSDMKSHVLEGIEGAFAYPLLNDPHKKEEFYKKLENFDAFVASFSEGSSSIRRGQEEEFELLNQIVSAKEALAIAAGNMFESYERHGTVDLSLVLAFEHEIDVLIPSIDRFLQIEGAEVAEAQERIQSTIVRAERLTLGLVLAAVILAICLGLLISSSISRPIARLRNAALIVGQGDLSVRTAINSSDEIGQLALSFNAMAEQLEANFESLAYHNAELEQEVALREIAEKNLETQTQELARSNQELEQFAHVASHDLQEPLRMVSSYTQLLERRYKDQLDSDANEFIAYAVDGAKRMQTQINDLLAYSRVTTQGNPFEATDCVEIFESVLSNLKEGIQESGAVVTRDFLPKLPADASQLVSVFQNIIGNSIKYHGDQPPRIHVSAVESGNDWLFSFKDNGIGIGAEFAERIFEIFQRLHSRAKYSGSGIGLAICKKVIERHGGRIWVESEAKNGSNFRFALPTRQQ